MPTISRCNHFGWLLSVCLLLLLLLACESRDRFIGAYRVEVDSLSKQTEMILELKANGDGTWRVGDEDIPFVWYIKSGELRINTKGGGVIVGSVSKDAIQVTLPGAGTVLFKKVN
jgi:hypothetical protein